DQSIEVVVGDVIIVIILLEGRLLCGNPASYQELIQRAYSDEVLTEKQYFLAKREEQRTRHAKFGETEYNLEPNIKSSPGALRDIQTIRWITKRHLGLGADSEAQ